jgi:hypothetical protein
MPTTYSNNNERIFANTQILTGNTTLTPADSGKVIFLNAAGGGTVTLPVLKAGNKLKFIIGATNPTTAWIIDSAEGDNIDGVLTVDGAAVPAVAVDQINFVASTAVGGDYIELECDGVQWYVSGVGEAVGSITATDPS